MTALEKSPWIGVGLDGTLARYDVWKGIEHIGEPVPLMLKRVKAWLAEGQRVKIFTARVCGDDGRDLSKVRVAIELWCLEHIGRSLPITNVKDCGMIELWGERIDGKVV